MLKQKPMSPWHKSTGVVLRAARGRKAKGILPKKPNDNYLCYRHLKAEKQVALKSSSVCPGSGAAWNQHLNQNGLL